MVVKHFQQEPEGNHVSGTKRLCGRWRLAGQRQVSIIPGFAREPHQRLSSPLCRPS